MEEEKRGSTFCLWYYSSMSRVIPGLVLALVGFGLVGCSNGTTTIVPTVPQTSDSMASEPTEPEDAVASPQDEAQVDASGDLGTRENPLAIGSSVILDGGQGPTWEVTLSAPTLEANQLVLDENMFNEAPPEGFQYALLPVSATYLGDETGTAAWDLEFVFVSAASTTHKEFDFSVVGPNELSDSNELYEGGVAEGNVFIAIPTLDAAEGTWRVSTSWADTVAFFAAQ